MANNKKEQYLPTLEEIRLGCLEVQKKWTNDDFYKRASVKVENYKVPVCEVEPSINEHSSEQNIYRFG